MEFVRVGKKRSVSIIYICMCQLRMDEALYLGTRVFVCLEFFLCNSSWLRLFLFRTPPLLNSSANMSSLF